MKLPGASSKCQFEGEYFFSSSCFSLHISWKIPDTSWRACVWLPSGFHYYLLFVFYDAWRWKQNFSTSWPTLTKIWKAEQRRIPASFALLMYFLQLIHLKNSILCLVPSWQCLWGWEQEILPRAVHRKGLGVTATSQSAECHCPAFGWSSPRCCLKL